jgi:penicillin-binding protein 1A
VRPKGLADDEASHDLLGGLLGGPTRFPQGQLEDMQTMLKAVVDSGTGRGAQLPIPTYGKTGTTQDNRDALFIGYAGGVVAGVWLGNDDNTPNAGLSGGGIPARVWRDFMTHALNIQAPPPPPAGNESAGNETEGEDEGVLGAIGGLLGNGTVEVQVDTAPDTPPPPEKGRRDDLIPPPARPTADDRRPAADMPKRPAPRPNP